MKITTTFLKAVAAVALSGCTNTVPVQETFNGNITRGQQSGQLRCDLRATGSAPTVGGITTRPTTGTTSYDCRTYDVNDQIRDTNRAIRNTTATVASIGGTLILLDNLVDRFNFIEQPEDASLIIEDPAAFLAYADDLAAMNINDIQSLAIAEHGTVLDESFIISYKAEMARLAVSIRAAQLSLAPQN